MKTLAKILCLSLVAVMLCATLASCAPARDPDKAQSALKDAGYTTTKDSTILPGILNLSGIKVETILTGVKSGEYIAIFYFEDSASAKDAEEKLSEYIDEEMKDDIDAQDCVLKRSGAMIYYGTENAVKDAR